MNSKFLEGIISLYQLYIADLEISRAGFGLFIREEVPPRMEVLRVTLPTISAI